MRKMLPLSLLLCVLLLAGCRNVASLDVNFDPGREISKAQRVVVAGADGTEKAVLESEDEIDAFVAAMHAEGWRLAGLPDGVKQTGSFALWQEGTITAGKEEAEFQKLCTFLVYDDADYLTIDSGFAGVTITFSVPEASSEYLHGLLQ